MRTKDIDFTFYRLILEDELPGWVLEMMDEQGQIITTLKNGTNLIRRKDLFCEVRTQAEADFRVLEMIEKAKVIKSAL